MVPVIKNLSWQASEKVLSGLYLLLIHALLARELGATLYGQFAYMLAIVAVLTPVAGMGVDIVFSNRILREGSFGIQHDFLTPLFVKLVVGAVAIGLVCFANSSGLVFSGSDSEEKALLILLCLLLTASSSIFESYLQVVELGRAIAISKLFVIILSAPLKIYFIVGGFGVHWIALAFLIESLLLFSVLLFSVRDAFYWKLNISFSRAKAYLRSGVPLVAAAIVVVLYIKTDELMIANMLGSGALALYVAATKIVLLFGAAPILLTAIAFPRVSKVKKQSIALYERAWRGLFTIMFYSSLILCVVIYLLSEDVAVLVFGNDYKLSADVIRIYVWSLVFVFVGTASTRYMVYEGLQKLSLYTKFVGLCVNVALNFLLIPRHGIEGAAAATLISQVVATFLSLILFKNTRRLFGMQIRAVCRPDFIALKKQIIAS